MTYHIWGDDWPHWAELYEAEEFIINYVYKWSRCSLVSKEKYGTLRYEWLFPPFGGCRFGPHIKLPYFTRTYEWNGVKEKHPIYLWIWNQSSIYRKWEQFGHWVLQKAIKKASIKFPNVAEEIREDFL